MKRAEQVSENSSGNGSVFTCLYAPPSSEHFLRTHREQSANGRGDLIESAMVRYSPRFSLTTAVGNSEGSLLISVLN